MSTITSTISQPNVSTQAVAKDIQDAGKMGVLAVFKTLMTWQIRYVERRRMLDLSDHALRDMGLSRSDLRRAGQKPFWRA